MDYISYEKFGVNFVRHAVTAERVAASLTEMAGDRVEVGPTAAGPGNIASATATGRIGAVRVTPDPGELVRFMAVLPIDLDLDVRLGPVSNRFTADVEVPLALTVRTAEPLTLVIDINNVTPSDVRVTLRSTSVGGDVLQRVGNMEAEVQTEVARTVNARLISKEARVARIIDVAALVEKSWG